MTDDEEDREEVLYRGTTYDAAQKVFAQKCFEIRETHFASSRELAEYFAVRSCGKRSGASHPAVIRVVLYESDLRLWKRNKYVRSTDFSEGDRPELRGKTQLIFSAEGMRFLNTYMFPADLRVEQIDRANPLT